MKRIVFIFLLISVSLAGCAAQHTAEKVENIIFLIGDGMGLAHVTALSAAQDYAPLNLERAQYAGFQKTYSANNRVTDSAASGTALACGEKTDNGTIGLTPDSVVLISSMDVARSLGKATGIVVTELVTGATPASFYAHVMKRSESEKIAAQLLDSGVDVIAGSGRANFNERSDGRDLIELFKEKGYAYYSNKNDFLKAEKTPAILLSAPHGMVSVLADTLGERGDYLAETVAKSIELLENSGRNGFFLMVEGSQIDHAAHANDIAGVVAETLDFDKAVKVAFDYADTHPGTLVVVTADHETGGLTLVSQRTDFTLPDAGVNFDFSTTSHSGIFVPVYAYGTGAENFSGIMENTDISKKMKELLGKSARK